MDEGASQKCSYVIQSDQHCLQTTAGLCNLIEHQSLVDILLCCGNNCLHAHKIVLACHSKLFRTEFEQNPNIEQVIFSGCDFKIIKALVKFMYDGETCVSEANASNFIAMAKMLHIDSLHIPLNYEFSDSLIDVPKPIFITAKPKYPTFPFKPASSAVNILKSTNSTISNSNPMPKVNRRMYLDAEHQACMKEAIASKLALANLKKEISSAPQPPIFIIEDSYTETTVENFIPADRKNFVTLDVDELNPKFEPKATDKSDVILTVQNGEQRWTANKIKQVLENRANSNVEVMFKTADGTFVTVTDEVLRSLQKEGLQYQVIDEDGKLGEVQELNCLRNEPEEQTTQNNICDMEFQDAYATNSDPNHMDPTNLKSENDIMLEVEPTTLYKSFNMSDYLQPLSKTEEDVRVSPVEDRLKFSPEIFFADFSENL
ncbi:uncharacterized protein [Diabrotica undecimpunctata]|uniref:uncharacterized protein n=1 Tax=Diabrotica undecimpunctata TaxID=50387 RepID=UPI003B6359EB